eukprot:TRINITY_DN1843_c0_g2_i5.p2 TRINITY_DN1843_c0_g2~~TRINITY_DN1843_c0_g2_i5.p2  ORF type:complete len:273 (+),score=7.13 TRINITY_DN1843_c0_g2_i5:487-1305(+)
MYRSPEMRTLRSKVAVGRTIYAITDKLQSQSTEEMAIILNNETSDVNRSGSSRIETAETALKNKNELRNSRRGIVASVLGLQQAIPIYNPTGIFFGELPITHINTEYILDSANSILGLLGASKSAEELIKEESDEIIPAWKTKVKQLDPDTQTEILGKIGSKKKFMTLMTVQPLFTTTKSQKSGMTNWRLSTHHQTQKQKIIQQRQNANLNVTNANKQKYQIYRKVVSQSNKSSYNLSSETIGNIKGNWQIRNNQVKKEIKKKIKQRGKCSR